MYIVDTHLFNNIIENERKWHQEKKAFKDDYKKCLTKEDNFLLSLMQQRKDDEKRCDEMKKNIIRTKTDIKTISAKIANTEKENQDLKTQIKNIDAVIQNKITDDEDVNPRFKNVTRRTKVLDKTYDNSDVLKTTHKTIIHKLNLYKEYLGCNVMFEEPNIYVFSFLLNSGQGEGCIKFQFDTEWTVIECKPDNLLTNEDIEGFHKLQDTQKLIGPLLLR